MAGRLPSRLLMTDERVLVHPNKGSFASDLVSLLRPQGPQGPEDGAGHCPLLPGPSSGPAMPGLCLQDAVVPPTAGAGVRVRPECPGVHRRQAVQERFWGRGCFLCSWCPRAPSAFPHLCALHRPPSLPPTTSSRGHWGPGHCTADPPDSGEQGQTPVLDNCHVSPETWGDHPRPGAPVLRGGCGQGLGPPPTALSLGTVEIYFLLHFCRFTKIW